MRRRTLVLVIAIILIGSAQSTSAGSFELPPGARPGPVPGLYFVPGSHDSLLVDAFGMLYAYAPQDESGRMQILPTGRRYQGASTSGVHRGDAPAGRIPSCEEDPTSSRC